MFSPEGYLALTEAAGVVRRGDRGVLAVTGSDRLTWLQGLLTNDVLALPIGGICDAAYLTPQGRMITDLRVFNHAEYALLDVPASLTESLSRRLQSLLFSEDAEVRDASSELAIVDIHGPRAVVLSDGEEVVRDDAYELPAVSAFMAVGAVEAFVERVVGRGASETTLETLDVVRVEAGRPAFLSDMDEHTIPLEAGLESRAISFTKGCYVGQEVIVRIMQRGGGRVAKKLVGFRFSSPEVPRVGSTVQVGDREIGRITSAVLSPALGVSIALGWAHRDFTAPGTEVVVIAPHSGERRTAEVSSLPFIPLALRLQRSGA